MTTSKDLARPSSILDGVAADTWEAYNAMQTTKQRHYDVLQILENKKKLNRFSKIINWYLL